MPRHTPVNGRDFVTFAEYHGFDTEEEAIEEASKKAQATKTVQYVWGPIAIVSPKSEVEITRVD